MEYNTLFSTRCHSYAYAVNTYPGALQREFEVAVEELHVQPTDIVLNIPAACASLEHYLQEKPKHMYEFETTEEFAKLTNTPTCSFFSIPLPDQSVTKIISLASLHHMHPNERPSFYRECKRLLQPGGELIIGDVKHNSPPAHWLNTFVDMHNPFGHKGHFWSSSDCDTLVLEGFATTMVERNYTWNFDSKEAMIDFTSHLFGVNCDSNTVSEGLNSYLTVKATDHRISFPWSLVYLHAKI